MEDAHEPHGDAPGAGADGGGRGIRLCGRALRAGETAPGVPVGRRGRGHLRSKDEDTRRRGGDPAAHRTTLASESHSQFI